MPPKAQRTQDGDGGYVIGQLVQVCDDVRPARFRQVGTVIEINQCVPLAIVEALHRDGKITNNGDVEIGVHLGVETYNPNDRTKVWFLPHELTPV